MDLEMVLNELSLRPLASDVYGARQRMAIFLETIMAVSRAGVKPLLRTQSNFSLEELAPGYSVIKWLGDKNVERELRQRYRSVATSSPFLDGITEDSILERFKLSDYFWEEKQAVGLGVAFLLEALALSLSSDPCWTRNFIRLKVSQLGDDGEIIDVFEDIPHASIADHVVTHLPWIKQRLATNMRADAREGLDIWLHKKEWFPHLYFCEQLEEQLHALKRGNLMLIPVLKRLLELEDYCIGWQDVPFDHTRIVSKASPESQATLETYGSEHTFRCHDGVLRLFSWHVRLTPSAWRLFFYPLPEERKLIVGYVGSKLPTVLYKH